MVQNDEPLFELSTSFSAIAFVEAYDDMYICIWEGFIAVPYCIF